MNFEYVRPKLHPAQQLFVDDAARFTWIEAGTKSGKTIGMIIWLHEQAIGFEAEKGRCRSFKKQDNFWWVAPYYSTAKIALNRWWEWLAVQYKPYFKKNESEPSITYPNGNKVYFKSAEKPDALYGEDVAAAVFDECSRSKEASFFALRTTLTATQGRAKFIGNVKGKKNWFYKRSQEAKAEGVGYHILTSFDNPFLHSEEIEAARKELPEDVFKELYLSIPTEDGSNPFGVKYIEACIKPISKEPAVGYGIDLAKSYDWTVITGLDKNGDVCFFERFQKDWKQTKERIIEIVGRKKALIDSTGVGDPIVEDVCRSCPNASGYNFSSKSKQQLMEWLAAVIQRQEISVLEGVMFFELESFEFVHTRTGTKYSAPEGMHDDAVCSLALAAKVQDKAIRYGRYAIR